MHFSNNFFDNITRVMQSEHWLPLDVVAVGVGDVGITFYGCLVTAAVQLTWKLLLVFVLTIASISVTSAKEEFPLLYFHCYTGGELIHIQ